MDKAFEHTDVAIVGGGPAGMQAALVLARTRKKVVVFDAPEPPRNAASHGVHNFLGLDGMLPAEIRKQAWQQIDLYEHAELRRERVTDVEHTENGEFIVTADTSGQLLAKKVILALGYHDNHPDIDGFADAWADTIIPCPFCDGYENRDRIWGVVANFDFEATHFPKMVQNWTKHIKIIMNDPSIELEPSFEQEMMDMNIPIHRGVITSIKQADGKVQSVTLDTGERINVETLLWSPPEEQSPLVTKLIAKFDLALNDMGYLKTDESQETNIPGLYAAGDVQGWSGGIEAATAGGMAAFMITHNWYG
ncbi:MAG: NAD(P)/FAD-dependent oxidoreductase [Chloroflexota bacterium]